MDIVPNATTKYNALYSLFGVMLASYSMPVITPNTNGTISFEWETKKKEPPILKSDKQNLVFT
jgi:hypothetical protein